MILPPAPPRRRRGRMPEAKTMGSQPMTRIAFTTAAAWVRAISRRQAQVVG